MTAKTSTFDNPADINSDNGIYASTAVNSRVIYMNFSDVTTLPGIVTAVRFKVEHYAVVPGDDYLGLNVTNGDGALNTWACSLSTWGCNDTIAISNIAMTDVLTISTVDLTALYATWDEAKLNSIGAVIRANRTGGQNFTYVGIDHAWLEVEYIPFSPTITPTVTPTITGTPPTPTVTPTITETATYTSTQTSTVTMTFTVTPTATCAGVVRYVGAGQTYTTITAALTAAGACDIIEITENITENVILDKNVTEIRGSTRAVVWNGTGNNTSRTLSITNGVTQLVRINNITFDHDSGTASTVFFDTFGAGGKLHFYDVTFRHAGGTANILNDKGSTDAGYLTIERCIFECSAGDIAFWSGSVSAGTTYIKNSIFRNGGIGIQFASSGTAYVLTLLNNTIAGFTTAGMRINVGADVRNNVFAGNTADLDIFGLNAKRTDFYNNSFGTESSAGFSAAGGNLFGITTTREFADFAANDLRLTRTARSCNAGGFELNVQDDILKNTRGNEGVYDIGAYEYIRPGDAARYNFENGTMQGWAGDGVTYANVMSPSAFGSRAARMDVAFTGSGWEDEFFILDNDTNPEGVIEAWIYVPTIASGTLQSRIIIQDIDYTWTEGPLTDLAAGAWTRVVYDLGAVVFTRPCTYIRIAVIANTSTYAGPVYIDSINFSEAAATPTPSPFPTACLQPDNFDDASLASFWLAQDIGSPVAGSQTETTALTITANGFFENWERYDEFRFVSQYINGDFDVSLDIINVPSNAAWSRSGIMVRENGNPEARYLFIGASRDNNYTQWWRNTTGSWSQSASGGTYLNASGGRVRLVRTGNFFACFGWNTGLTSWEQIGADTYLEIGSAVMLGIAVTSHEEGVTGGSSVDNFNVSYNACMPTNTPTNTPVTGLKGVYYDNIDFTEFALCRRDSAVNFNWSAGAPDPSMGNESYSVRWTGQIRPEFSEVYTFYVVSDDGAKLWVDGQEVVDSWYNHGAASFHGYITLTAEALYDLQLDFFEASGDAVVQLYWSSPSQPIQIIPGARLLGPDCGPAPTPANTATPFVPPGCIYEDNFNDSVISPYWHYVRIGPATTGADPVESGDITLNVINGYTYKGLVDQGGFFFQEVSGDIDVSVKVTQIPNLNSETGMGLMMREKNETDSRQVFIYVSQSLYYVYSRAAAGAAAVLEASGPHAGAPVWLRLARAGGNFTAYISPDGSSWLAVASFANAMSSAAYAAGLILECGEQVASTTGRADDFMVIAGAKCAIGTPTNTPTVTPTSSATQTVTQTVTQTATETVTQTATPTATQTITATATSSVTATVTQTVTATATRSATPSVTATITETVTITVTQTVTMTITQTATPSVTPTVTETVTGTVTQTVTPSVTATATQTATATITQTVTPSVTATMTETVTTTVTHTVTPTVTQTATPSVTATVTETVTTTITQTVTQSVTATVTETVTTTITQTVTPSSTPTVTETVTMTVTQTATPSVTATGTQTITTTITQTVTPTVTQTATPSVTATVTQTITTTITQTATQSVTATVTVTVTMTTTITQTVTPTVTATVTETVTTTVTQTVTPSVTATVTETVTATVTPSMTASVTETVTPTITQTVTSTITATVTETITATATQTVTPSVTATVSETITTTVTQTVTQSVTATVTETITQTATQTVTATVTETITATETQTVTPSITSTVSETVTTTVTQTVTQSVTATVTETVTMTATQTVTATVTETITATATQTVTPSITSTVSETVTTTVTQTVTTTVTQTATPNITDTVTETVTATITQTATTTVTPTATQSVTATVTVTETVTTTITQTVTETATQTVTDTATSTETNTPTPTMTGTVTQTITATITQTPSGTATQSITATSTPTATPTDDSTSTFTATPTATPTATGTFTVTSTPTVTQSGTITPTIQFTYTITRTHTITPTITMTHSITPTITASPTATPAAFAHVEPALGVAGDLTELKYRVASRNDGLITQLRIRIPSGVTAQAPSSSRSGAAAAVVSGEVRVYYDTGWNAFSNPNFDIITFYVTSTEGVKIFTSYLNALGGAECAVPAGYSQSVNFIAPTLTSTPTVTLTATATPTNTPYQSPTHTVTRTYTVTATVTQTHTDTPVYSPTLTPTGTMPTSTNTPTITQTETLTHTPTNTPTPTNTQTYTATVTATVTVTLTPTVTNTITIKGMDLSRSDTGGDAYSGGFESAPVITFYFTNIGGADEIVRGVTLTALNRHGNYLDISAYLGNIYAVDAEGSTVGTCQFTGAASSYLEFDTPVNVRLQGTSGVTLYADVRDISVAEGFRLGIAAEGDVNVSVPVSSSPGYSFPMMSRLIELKVLNKELYAQGFDLMPPSVSTGQQNVNCYIAAFRNPGTPGRSSSVITGVTVTVRDENSNPINAQLALTGVRITDGSGTVYGSAAAGGSPYVYINFTQPVEAAAGAMTPLYINADITGNTINRSAGFRVSLDSAAFVPAKDFYYEYPVTISADTGYTFPFISTAAVILNRAVKIDVSSSDSMPAGISAGQQNVKAMELILTNVGDTLTASAMVSRINFYITDINGAPVDPLLFISNIAVTASDGSVYGAASVFTGNKIGVNLVSPVIVSGALPVVLGIKIDAAAVFSSQPFRVMVNSANDIYAVDSNVFQAVEVTGVFPDISGSAVIYGSAVSSQLGSFTPLLPASAAKGALSVPVMSFDITNPSAPGTADAEIWKMEFDFTNSSGAAIAADSACSAFYLVESSGATVSATTAGTLGTAVLYPASPLTLAPLASRSFTLYADIRQQAYASDFRVSAASVSSAGVRDSNSRMETVKTAAPAMPWNTGVCSVTAAPATSLAVWHDGTFAPVQAGGGQPGVLMMSVSFYNGAFEGSSAVRIDGLELNITDQAGAGIPAMSVLGAARIINFSATEEYGSVSLASEGSAYGAINFSTPVYVAAGTTFTAYVSVDVASSASGSFRVALASAASVNAQNHPSGAISVLGAFPLRSDITAITSLAYDLRAGRVNLMPLSAAAGETGVEVMELTFQNNSVVAMQITGVTLTVKTPSGSPVAADGYISLISVYSQSGAHLFDAAVGTAETVYFEPVLLLAPGASDSLNIRVSLPADSRGAFYLELVSPSDVSTDIGASVNPAAGQYFGNIRSSVLSVQPRSMELSYHGFPNPFNPAKQVMTIEYFAENQTEATINIYTPYGRHVKNIAQRALMPQGLNSSQKWDGTNESGHIVKSGIYLMILESRDMATGAGKKLTRKIVVLK